MANVTCRWIFTPFSGIFARNQRIYRLKLLVVGVSLLEKFNGEVGILGRNIFPLNKFLGESDSSWMRGNTAIPTPVIPTPTIPTPAIPTVEFYLYRTVSTALIHSVKPELTE